MPYSPPERDLEAEWKAKAKAALEQGVLENNEAAVRNLLFEGASLVDRDALILACSSSGHFSMLKLILMSPEFKSSNLNIPCQYGFLVANGENIVKPDLPLLCTLCSK